jgi:hypothetical protein
MNRRLMQSLALALLALPGTSLVAQQKAPATPAPARGTGARADTAGRIVFEREVYRYPREGRRDPFASLIATGDIRPIFSDLVLSGIVYDPSGRASMATLRDVSTNELYRARVGSVFGRIRVTAIRQREVLFAIDEFGYSRQEILSLNVPSPAERTP